MNPTVCTGKLLSVSYKRTDGGVNVKTKDNEYNTSQKPEPEKPKSNFTDEQITLVFSFILILLRKCL